MIDFLTAALPIVALIIMITMPRPLSSTIAFFLAASLAFGLRLFYFQDPAILLFAAVISGLLEALTPITIIFGAIFFFMAMERSGAMNVVRGWLRSVSPNPVAQIMLAGWAFIFLIEGASGFGTPAALAAPILAGLGLAAIRVALLCLVFNSISTVFGAVGTPMWFGFSMLGLTDEELLAIGSRIALLQTLAAMIVPVAALRLVTGWDTIRRNIVFIELSILSCVLPMLAAAQVSYEFPSVLGGICGMVITILLARRGIGLENRGAATIPAGPLMPRRVAVALAPLAATVIILLVTRIPALGVRQWLTDGTPVLSLGSDSLGVVAFSKSLVLLWTNILGQGINWVHAVLFVPSLIPFLLTASLAFVLYRCEKRTIAEAFAATSARISRPVVALFGALVFVGLLTTGGERSSVNIIGYSLASAAGGAWIYFSPLLGGLGSFFSGSTTISNLTFGGIQASIAAETGIDRVSLLALQAAGASMGNIICIHNILAVCAVLDLKNTEGVILRTSLPLVALYAATLAASAALLFS